MEADIREIVMLMLRSSSEGNPKYLIANYEGDVVMISIVKGADIKPVKEFLDTLKQ